jgi:hypothetical protein
MLVDLESAKRTLRRDDDDDDVRIKTLVDTASEIILDYLKISQDSYSGTDGNLVDVPLRVQQATLLVVESLYDHPEVDPITPAVVSILMRTRDPAIC